MIEPRQLRYLIAAAEAGSFSRAARELNIKQSTLSRHISYIEKRLGLCLFDRSSRGVRLTLEGNHYLQASRRILADLAGLNSWVRSRAMGASGELTIGFHTSLSAGNLRATLTAFSQRYPEIRIRAREHDRSDLRRGLETGLVDIAVIIGEQHYGGLASRPLWSERLLVALPAGHRLANTERIGWADLAGDTFLVTSRDPGPETRNFLLSRIGTPSSHVRIEENDVSRETLLCLVSLGRHAAVVAESSIGIQMAGITLREVHENGAHARIGFSGYWTPENPNRVLKRFLDFVAARYSLPSIPK